MGLSVDSKNVLACGGVNQHRMNVYRRTGQQVIRGALYIWA